MVVIERSSSVSSSASSSKKEKQSRGNNEKDSNEVMKGKLVRKTSSNSSPSTPSKKGKQGVSCLKDNTKVDEEGVGRKLARKTSSSSISSPCTTPSKKGKRSSVSCLKESNHEEVLKGKLTRKGSSLSSCPSPRKDGVNEANMKEKHVRRGSLLSTSSLRSPTKKELRGSSSTSGGNGEKTRKSNNSLIKSRIKELGPICKKRKEVLNSISLEEDIDVYLDEQINEEGRINPNDCMWLSSGSMSPQEFGLFMSALDPGLDEWVMSLLPRSSRAPKPDGSKMVTLVSEAEAEAEGDLSGVVDEVGVKGSCLARTDSLSSSCSSSAAVMSTYAESSTFWNMDRTGVWVSLINLDGEDSKFISDVDSKLDDLESDFPSPNFKGNWDSNSSDVGVSSSAKSTTHESGSQSEWSSDLLSDSMDWEVDSDDPIYWPYGVDCDWDHKCMDSFSISPRKGLYKIRFKSGEDGCANIPRDSIRFRLHGKNGKKILFLSGLSASKMIEFKKGCRKNAAGAGAGAGSGSGSGPARGKRFSKIGKRGNRYKRRVPPILENDLEGISPKDTPKESLKKGSKSSYIDLLSESADNWGDGLVEMDSDSPIYWPTDQKTDWDNGTWDSFNVSPRKSTESNTSPGSPKNCGFSVSSSVRLKFLPKKIKLKSASKSFRYNKSVSHHQKTNTAVPDKRLMVVVPRKGRSLFKSNKKVSFKHGSQGNKRRDLPLKGGKSVKEFIRLVSILGVNKMFPGNEVANSEELLPIETLLGLNEFDGNEGVDMELEDADFSIMERVGG